MLYLPPSCPSGVTAALLCLPVPSLPPTSLHGPLSQNCNCKGPTVKHMNNAYTCACKHKHKRTLCSKPRDVPSWTSAIIVDRCARSSRRLFPFLFPLWGRIE
eukprot:EG_transcript_67455